MCVFSSLQKSVFISKNKIHKNYEKNGKMRISVWGIVKVGKKENLKKGK